MFCLMVEMLIEHLDWFRYIMYCYSLKVTESNTAAANIMKNTKSTY